jgi:hypothetical protein
LKNLHYMVMCLVMLLPMSHSEGSYAQSGMAAVLNRPFFANEWVTKTTAAPDGSISVTTQQIAIARASDGTVRREIHEASPGSSRVLGNPIVIVSIINHDTKASSAIVQGKSAVTAMAKSDLQNRSTSAPQKNGTTKSANSTVAREISSFNGLQAVVNRSQYTVPASGPNDKTRTVTSELWYSPDVRVTLKSSVSDSTGNSVVSVLDDIHQQEPDSALFHSDIEVETTQR